MQLEEIKINITADTKSAIISLTQLGNALKTLDKLGGKGTNLSKINAEVMQFAKSISSLSDRTISNLSKLADAFGRLSGIKVDPSVTKAVADLGAQAKTAATSIWDIEEKVVDLNEATQQTDLGASRYTPDQTWIDGETQSLEGNADAAASDAAQVREVAKASNENALAKKKSTTATNQETTATKANTSAKKAGSTATRHYSNALTRLAATFKRILLYRAIRGIIRGFTQALKTGITNLYEYSQALGSIDGANFANTMDAYASVALKLKNSLAVALAPVINAVLPLVQKLAGWLVTAANAIARFFAALNGQDSYTIAKDVATTWGDDAEKSISGANDAAEELKRTLLGFDEINALDKPNKGGSGGGSGKGGSAKVEAKDMFENVPVGELSGVWKEIADTVQRVYETIVNAIGWLENIGVFDEIKDAIEDIVGYIAEIVGSPLFQALLNSVLTSSTILLKDTLLIIADALGVIAAISNGDFGEGIKKFGDLVIDILGLVLDATYTIVESIAAAFYEVYKWVGNAFADIVEKAGFKEKADEIRNIVNNHANEMMEKVHGMADDIDATTQRSKIAWELLFEGGAELAKSFSESVKELNAETVEGIYRAWQDGRYQIEQDKITFDVDADGVYETFFDITGKYNVMVEDVETGAYEMESALANGFGGAGRSFGEATDSMISNVGDVGKAIDDMADGIGPDLDDGLDDASSSFFEWLADITKDANEGFGGFGKSFEEGVSNGFGGAGRAFDRTLNSMTSRWTGSMDTTLSKLEQSWKGMTLTTKNLPVSDKGAKATMDGTATYWKNENFQNKSLEVTTGKTKEAMNAVRDYWDNLSFKKKGIGVTVNLPQGTSVSYYAQGGLVDSGELFVARENAAPELVGTMGGHTAVANNAQIIAGISNGVSDAMSSQNSLLVEQNNLLKGILAKSGNVVISTSSIIDGLNRTNRRAGKSIVAVG